MTNHVQVLKYPVLNKVAIACDWITKIIFCLGVAAFIIIILVNEKSLHGVEAAKSLFPAFFLFVCSILADPCIYGLTKVSIDPYKYFSETIPAEKGDVRYNPNFIVMYLVSCGLIASLLLTGIEEGQMFFVAIFAVAYIVATFCMSLIIFYRVGCVHK